jgi:hypothetical protein
VIFTLNGLAAALPLASVSSLDVIPNIQQLDVDLRRESVSISATISQKVVQEFLKRFLVVPSPRDDIRDARKLAEECTRLNFVGQ